MTNHSSPDLSSQAPLAQSQGVLEELLAIFYGTLVRPSRTFAEVARSPLPLIIPAVVGTVLVLFNLILGFSQMGGVGMVKAMLLPAIMGVIFFLFLMTAVFHLLASFMGGKGDVTVLFSLFFFSQIPRILTPSASMAATLPGTGLFLGFLFSMVISLWSFYLTYVAIKSTYQFSGEKAFIVLILPGLLVFSFILSLFWSAFSGLSRLASL